MIQIIADNKIPFLKGVLEPYAQVSYLSGAQTDASVIKNADALITRTRTKCNKTTLINSKVKMIATATIGFDHIDTGYCDRNNIKWTNAPGCNSGSVLQYIASTLATIATDLNISLAGKTLGIIGVGNVGNKVKEFAEIIGMKVLLNDPPRAEKEGNTNFTSLSELIEQSDIITFHVPLQHKGQYKTFHLGNNTLFSRCKKDAIIINSSRGEVINNADLQIALNTGTISHAILDVWENEPDINIKLLKLAFLATPHIAGYSADGKANGTAHSVQALSQYFNLPLKTWYPEDIPTPENTKIIINAKGASFQDVWTQAVLHTYTIKDDDKRLRDDTNNFEQLRGAYPLRREFKAYHIQLMNGSEELRHGLNKMGFGSVQLI